MTIPFLNYFKRGKTNGAAAEKAAPKPVLPPLEKPNSERFSKTVMPNATRTLAPQDPFEMAARATTLGVQMPSAATTAAPRTVSFSPNSSAMAAQRDLPPAVALALEPQVERVISIELRDLLSEMPEGFVKPAESIDSSRRVLLKASEVEKGMASGKPTVSLATVYQQVPEIFIRKIEPGDASQLQLPFNKVLDAFAKMHVRADQERAHAVPQVETPFLKVTLEDNETFGTTTEPLETTELPPVRLQPPTAEAFAAAEPEVAAEARLKMSPPPSPNGNGAQKKRIPFKLSPNGTDVPAPESVPASSGPSVPNLLPSPFAPVAPGAGLDNTGTEPVSQEQSGSTPPTSTRSAFPTTTPPVRIPFKMVVPPPSVEEEEKPKAEPWLTKDNLGANDGAAEPKVSATAVSDTSRPLEVKISLPLLPILKSLPPMQLTGDPSSVPSDVRLELPFSLVEPQLASGRVTVTAKVFEVSMPVSFRGLFQAGAGTVDVLLPLQEVLKNLPAASLRMRDDQEEQEAGQNFATPFAAKADEDAKRFNVPATPVPKPLLPEPVSEVAEAAKVEVPDDKSDNAVGSTAIQEQDSDRPLRTPLQVALNTDEKLDAKGVVALINKIPGVKACTFLFGDGLSLAGSLPPELETEGICAMAPSLMQRLENHLVDTKLGLLRGMTLSCVKGTLTFYMHENLCLGALHADLDLPGETREKLSRIVHEMSRKYSHPV